MAPNQPVRMKAVIYALSPYQQNTMPGLWKNMGHKIQHKFEQHGFNTLVLLVPVIGTYTWAQKYVEKEKLHHRS